MTFRLLLDIHVVQISGCYLQPTDYKDKEEINICIERPTRMTKNSGIVIGRLVNQS